MQKKSPHNKNVILYKTVLICMLCLSLQTTINAHSNEDIVFSKHNVYLDAGLGPLYQASLNYEFQIHSAKTLTWYARLGAGGAGTLLDDGGPGGLAAITMLTGKKNSHFELNAGTFIGSGSDGTFVYPLLDIGYRYQQPDGGFIFKAKVGILGIGIGLGFAF